VISSSDVAHATRMAATETNGRIRLACFTGAEHPPSTPSGRVTITSQRPFFFAKAVAS
jgi:hypothetical protein